MATKTGYAIVVVMFALAGCKQASPTTPKDESVFTPTSGDAVKPKPGSGGVPADGPPWSEGEANQKLKGMTDEEVKSLLGKPDTVSKSSDLQFTEWGYDQAKWLKPAEGSVDTKPSGMVLQLKDGKVRKLYRVPGR